MAATEGHLEVVRVLVKAGADAQLRDKVRETCLRVDQPPECCRRPCKQAGKTPEDRARTKFTSEEECGLTIGESRVFDFQRSFHADDEADTFVPHAEIVAVLRDYDQTARESMPMYH